MDSSLAAERTTTRARASLPTQEALAELLPKVPTGPVADAEIRRRVLEEINNQRWTPPNNIDAKVEDGTVELRGVVLSEAERAALWVVAENEGCPRSSNVAQATVWDNNRTAHGLLSRARSLLGDSFASSVYHGHLG